jgi:hypothetical protein
MTGAANGDRRLLELAQATSALKARPGFNQQVMLAVAAAAAAPVWWGALDRRARFFVPLAALAALFCVSWALMARQAVDDSLALAYGSEVYTALEADF